MKKQTFLINLILSFLVGLATFLIIPCDKNDDVISDEIGGSNMGFSDEVIEQLKAAKAATEKYSTIDQTLADDYVDINMIQQNMGVQLFKTGLSDTVFNSASSQILVYNK